MDFAGSEALLDMTNPQVVARRMTMLPVSLRDRGTNWGGKTERVRVWEGEREGEGQRGGGGRARAREAETETETEVTERQRDRDRDRRVIKASKLHSTAHGRSKKVQCVWE